MTSISIQEYLAKRELLGEQTIVTEDTNHIDLDTMDKEALQQVIDWAKSCNIPEHIVPHNMQQLANQETLDIQAYTQTLPKALGSLTELKSLSLRNTESLPNGVEDRVPDSISDLINLEELSLDYEDYAFNFESLNKLKTLKHLTLCCYDTIMLPNELEKLRCNIRLHLRNKQGRLPANLVDIKNLIYLSIYDVNLTVLPSNIGALDRLKILSVHCQNLSHLPESLGALSQLSTLKVSSNCLDEIPESIGDLTSLTKLKVSCANLASLPQSMAQLNRLEELSVYSNQLKEVPQSIGSLSSLTKLIVRGESLRYLPESIELLNQLNKLVLPSDKIRQLPKGLGSLIKLRHLEINRELTTKISKSLIDRFRSGDLYLSGVPAAALYQPSMHNFPLSIIGCFIISDSWDKQDLLKLKERIGAYFLVGLQTDDNESERLDIVEGVVRCQPDEVNDVVKLLDVNAVSSLIAIDVVDIKSLFERDYSFQFIQASATGKCELDLIKSATHDLVSQVSKVNYIKRLLLATQSVESLSLDHLSYISETVEKSLSIDDEYIYYSASIANGADCFRLRAIYSEV
ncbi:leucine-rich repeat domain-containing protein [Psychrobacter jeotgali]|uniref:leucine-rich repeat domain-containing protein n=1 Tax=Psychrobacter jeotgali TaxID=179010 RepID=UPI001919A5B9|nr:leucine-rich repeat domain-containing protein [Psychrobacter jeotgali]